MFNSCGSLNRPSSKCYQKNLYHKSKSEKCQFHIILGQISFFVIFLCYRVKPFWAIPVAMVPIIRNFKTIICVCMADVYYVKYVSNYSYSVVLEVDSLL